MRTDHRYGPRPATHRRSGGCTEKHDSGWHEQRRRRAERQGRPRLRAPRLARVVACHERAVAWCPSTRYARSGHHSTCQVGLWACHERGLDNRVAESSGAERGDSNPHALAGASPSSSPKQRARRFPVRIAGLSCPLPDATTLQNPPWRDCRCTPIACAGAVSSGQLGLARSDTRSVVWRAMGEA